MWVSKVCDPLLAQELHGGFHLPIPPRGIPFEQDKETRKQDTNTVTVRQPALPQVTPCECGLQQVSSIHGTICLARSHEGVDFIDEEHDRSL